MPQQTVESGSGGALGGVAAGDPAPMPAGRGGADRASLDRRVVLPLVAVAVVIGALERWWVASHTLGTLTSDGSVVGLMALQLLHHGQLPTYFWGQSYGGSIEAVGSAAVFLVAGHGTSQLLAASALSSALAALALWRAGRRFVGDPAALLGALAFWIWPASVMLRSLKPGGSYMLGLALVLCGVGALARLHDGEDGLWVRVAAGLWCGLAFWATATSIQLLVPALLWSAPALWRLGRRFGAVVVGGLVGASPAIAYGLAHGWSNLLLPGGDGSALARFAPRFVQFFQDELPIALDLRVEGTLSWLQPRPRHRVSRWSRSAVLAPWWWWWPGEGPDGAGSPCSPCCFSPSSTPVNSDANHVGQGRYVLDGMTMAALLVGVGLDNGGRALARRRSWPRAQVLWAAMLALLALVGAFTLGREPGPVLVGLRRAGCAHARERRRRASARAPARRPRCVRRLLGGLPAHVRDGRADRGDPRVLRPLPAFQRAGLVEPRSGLPVRLLLEDRLGLRGLVSPTRRTRCARGATAASRSWCRRAGAPRPGRPTRPERCTPPGDGEQRAPGHRTQPTGSTSTSRPPDPIVTLRIPKRSASSPGTSASSSSVTVDVPPTDRSTSTG